MGDSQTEGDSGRASADGPTLEEPRTEYEEVLHKMGRLRADMSRMQRQLGEEDVSGELAAQLGFMSGDFNTLTREIIRYIEEGQEVPDTCPICGREVKEIGELEEGESYDIDQMCVEETTPGGTAHGLIHFTESDD